MDKNVWYAVFESVEDIVVVINTDFEIEHINRKGEECFGLHGESLQSKKCYDYICQNESPPGECPMQCHLTGEKPGKDQVIQSGSRHFKIATTPVKDADGEIVRFVDVLHDITKELETEKTLREQNDEIRALNEEYMAANEELKARNEEVTSLNEEYNSIIEDLRQTNEQLQDAKKKIEESEEMFRTTFDLAAVGIAHVSTEGKFLRLNQKFCDITGYTKNELAGMTFTEITHPEDLYLDKKYISEVFEGKRDAFTIEKRYIHKNGGIIWVNLYSNIVRDSSGKVKYAVAAITDITHQKESEKQLVFQSVLLDNINDLITATDLEGNIIYTNRKVKEFFNYQKNTPKHVLDYGENRDLGATQEEIIKNTLNHEKWRGEVVNYTKDGKELFLECRTQLIKDEHGKPYGMIGASTDISAQKAYEKELQQKNEELESQNEEYLALNEELQQTLKKLQSINTELEQRDKKLSLLLKASQTVLLFEDFDTTARKLFGFCKEYTGAQSGYVALLDENGKENEILFLDSGGLECRVDKSLPMPIRGLRNEAFKSLQGIYHNDFMNSEWKKYIPEGHAALRNVLFAPLIINKNAVGLIGLANKPGDFTEADRQTVDAVSEMCSIALHNANVNEKLVQAKLRAEESDHLKTAFLANMSHEIRTPMNGIIGFSDMLMKSDLTEEKRRLYAKIVVDSGNQLLNIVNDILDISLIEANALKLYIEEIAVNTIIMDLFAFFKPQFAKKNLALYIHKSLTDEQSIIRTDKNRLQQILSNLLNNAFKFTQEGFIRFGYDVIEDNLQFIVEDTGIGIGRDHLEKIFERFRQEDMGLARAYGGTGLGLSISQKLVERLGGKIWVESEKGKGTTFYFTIPYKPVKVSADNVHTEFQEEDAKKFTVLLAEDEEINHLYMEELLSDSNIRLLHAKNGKEALDICTSDTKIDLVLMDMKMPVLDGYEATKTIKKFLADLPIIAQSAYAKADEKEKAEEAGCDDYLPKPLKAKVVKSMIERYRKNE